jgi:hypothetical protein
MRIDNAFSYMMDRQAGSSKGATPPSYDAEDCHEYASSTIYKCTRSLTHVPRQGIHEGYTAATVPIFSLIHALFLLVFGYTEYKGKQKEIFDAAINGV